MDMQATRNEATGAMADARAPLAGRVAIVTGSTSGIGLGVARAFAEAGASVVLNGLGDRIAIGETISQLTEDTGARIAYHGANLMDPGDAARMVEDVIEDFGQLDILVNNAGIQHVAPLESFPPEKWDAVTALNLSAAFHTTRSAFAHMKGRGFGRIINVASAHALIASPFKGAYVAAKHGVLGLTKVAALEGAEFGITANAICPGYVWTPLVENQIEATAAARGISRDAVMRDVLLAAQPTKRFVEVEEIGALAVFLAGQMARSITGIALPVDGGWTAH